MKIPLLYGPSGEVVSTTGDPPEGAGPGECYVCACHDSKACPGPEPCRWTMDGELCSACSIDALWFFADRRPVDDLFDEDTSATAADAIVGTAFHAFGEEIRSGGISSTRDIFLDDLRSAYGPELVERGVIVRAVADVFGNLRLVSEVPVGAEPQVPRSRTFPPPSADAIARAMAEAESAGDSRGW